MKKTYLILFVLITSNLLNLNTVYGKDVIRIVVLGSSTAAGSGPTNPAKAWVNQYRTYIQSLNSSNEVINLAVGGYTTAKVLPDSYSTADPLHNITKALSYSPDAIIINLPTNDAANGVSVNQQLANYSVILGAAAAQNVPVWVTTTQPRYLSTELRQNLMDMRDSTYKYMGNKAIDFWTDIATDQGYIKSIFDIGDGTHLNDSAHTLLTKRVIAKNEILNYSRSDNDLDTINIDFGTSLSSGNWNNLDNARTDTVSNLINSQGEHTGISIWVSDSFTGINISGTTTPDASLNIPSTASSDSFFASVGAHEGVSEPTGGLTLSGLNTNSKYSFTFFASRAGVTDNRETSYTVTGTTEETVALNAANNVSNTVTVSDITPSSDGKIIISVAPGANNTNSLKYYFIGMVRIVAEKQQVVYDEDGTINIDFGSKASSGNWNNFSSPTGVETINDLINMEGNSTGYSLSVHDSFTGINETGTTSPAASLEIESNGSSDSFFGSVGLHSGVSEPTGGVTIGGLTTDSYYTLSFFASRISVTDNREAKYTVTGSTTESVTLDAANNTNNMVTVSNIHPATDGTIKVDVAPGANNNNSLKYYYLGVMRILYSPNQLNGLFSNKEDKNFVTLYPNPVKDYAMISYTLSETAKVQIQIYDIYGKLIHAINNIQSTQGTNKVKWDLNTDSDVKINSGIYLCKVNVLSGNNADSGTIKFQVK